MLENISPPSRRGFLAGLAGTSLAMAGGFAGPKAAAAAPVPGSLSGMPWLSGTSLGGITEIEAFRRRKADVYTIWGASNSWAEVPSLAGGFSSVKRLPGRISLAIAPLPRTHSAVTNPGNWKLAAKGAFDPYYIQHARNLAASGRTNLILRIGWETNHTFPWYGGTDPQGFKDTFNRIADIARKYNPTIQTEWCNIKKGKQKGSVLTLYPGDDAVDIVGVDYYDNWPALNTLEIWNKEHYATHNDGPKGLGAWLNFAKSRGKKLACAEWGLSVGTSPGTKDNPLYIQKMYEFFSANAAYIAYECYFNEKTHHQLAPANINPAAAAMYLKLWGV